MNSAVCSDAAAVGSNFEADRRLGRWHAVCGAAAGGNSNASTEKAGELKQFDEIFERHSRHVLFKACSRK